MFSLVFILSPLSQLLTSGLFFSAQSDIFLAMKESFRDHHLFKLLYGYENQDLPLDLYISHYFRDHRSLGPKDRGYIADTIYHLIRWQGLLDHLSSPSPATWENRLNAQRNALLAGYLQDEKIPPHIRVSFPASLFEMIAANFGEQKALELCLSCNSAAPTTVRANRIKTTREELLTTWQAMGYEVQACEKSENGIQFLKKISLFSLPEFKEGLFEVQDEASQLVSQMIEPQIGDHIMDYCAGSGGKTLAFAPATKNSGQIYLHDIRPWILGEAKKRLKRAGIQNAQVVLPDDEAKLKKLKKNMNWVFVDAPCSGIGTLRRNPDMKWKLDKDSIMRLVGQQRMIFEKALSFLKPGGRIVYATCSFLPEENEQQTEHFCKTYQLAIDGKPFTSLPLDGGMDGFYSVVLKKEISSE